MCVSITMLKPAVPFFVCVFWVSTYMYVCVAMFKRTVWLCASVLFVNSEDLFETSLDGPFGQMTWEEFKDKVLMAPQDCSATQGRMGYGAVDRVTDDSPSHVDWRDKGVVTRVKDQGHCGSCWTFSSTGAMESHYAIQFGDSSLELSEQQLLDCAGDFDNHGCNGGLPSHAFEYVHYADGIDSESGYPYKAAELGQCSIDRSLVKVRTSRSFNITEGDEDSIKHILANVGPVSIAFEVVDDFRLYKRGIYSSDVCKKGPMDVNHAVLIVGYGQAPESGKPYWIIKNSWGPNWGENGYFRMERGKNMCGVATCASYPVLEKGTNPEDEEVVNFERIVA